MKVSLLLVMAAAAVVTSSTAKATSVTIDFPTAGDKWCELASSTCGTSSGGGSTGALKSQYSFVTTYSTNPILNNFVATGVSVNIIITTRDTRSLITSSPTMSFNT